jgi:hypothetical protein
MQLAPINTKVVSSNPAYGEVYSIKHYLVRIKIVSGVGGFLRVSSGFWKRSALTNMKKDALKYMINRLWYGIFHITCLINPRPILAHGTSALGLKLASRVDMTCHVIWKMSYNFRLIHDLFHIALVISSRPWYQPREL